MIHSLLQAEASYKACLQHQEKHTAAKLALARLALATGQVSANMDVASRSVQQQNHLTSSLYLGLTKQHD